MKKLIGVFLTIALIVMIFPVSALAASASFSISGPSKLKPGETGTYTVSATLSDAAAVQATLVYDSGFFELVSGNTTGEKDYEENVSISVTLITVELKCIASSGSTGTISLSEKKASRFTGTVPPAESVSCNGGSKTVTCEEEPQTTPTPAPTPAPTPTPTPAATATPSRPGNHTATPKPSVTATETATASPSAEVATGSVSTPTATQSTGAAETPEISSETAEIAMQTPAETISEEVIPTTNTTAKGFSWWWIIAIGAALILAGTVFFFARRKKNKA